jgi:hypothetical protein
LIVYMLLVFMAFIVFVNDNLDSYFIYYSILIFLVHNSFRKISLNSFLLISERLLVSLGLYAVFITIPSMVVLGYYFYPSSYSLLTGVGSSVYFSNIMGLSLLVLILYVRLNQRFNTLFVTVLFLIFSLSGFMSGSRTFQLAFLIFIIIFFLTSGKYVRLSIGLLAISSLFILEESRLYINLFDESPRLNVWLSALSYDTLNGFLSMNLDNFKVSAFHNIVLDSVFIYGYYSILVLLVFFYFFALTVKRSFKLKGVDFYISIMFALFLIIVAFTSVVPRGDVMILFIGYSYLLAWCKIIFLKMRGVS